MLRFFIRPARVWVIRYSVTAVLSIVILGPVYAKKSTGSECFNILKTSWMAYFLHVHVSAIIQCFLCENVNGFKAMNA